MLTKSGLVGEMAYIIVRHATQSDYSMTRSKGISRKSLRNRNDHSKHRSHDGAELGLHTVFVIFGHFPGSLSDYRWRYRTAGVAIAGVVTPVFIGGGEGVVVGRFRLPLLVLAENDQRCVFVSLVDVLWVLWVVA